MIEELGSCRRIFCLARAPGGGSVATYSSIQQKHKGAIRRSPRSDLSSTTFAARGGEGRVALSRLLGEERLRVRPDSERGFAVEGEFSWLVPASGAALPVCRDSVVAGTRYARNAAGGALRILLPFAA